ncbi:MAG TPA: response regulator [Stellaceae bacterium]|jgi:DNA-binding response OmpR family regulator|nr:response regulator [Stellaceae bacterium]
MEAPLRGLRVLLVEDEPLVAELIVDVLEMAGCSVVGPVPRLDAAVRAAETEAIDAALLDLDLAGKRSYPVAAALAARKVPFLFLTGYGQGALAPEYAACRTVAKPFKPQHLIDLLARTVEKAAP